MKIGFTTGYLYEYSIDKILNIASELEVQAIELQPELYYVNFGKIRIENLQNKIRTFQDETDIEVTIHLPFLDVNLLAYYEELRNASESLISQWLEFSKDAEIKTSTMHIGHTPFGIIPNQENYLWNNIYENMIPHLKRILNLGKEFGIKIGIENLPNKPGRFPVTTEHFDWLKETIGNFNITFDVAHAKFMSNDELEQFMQKYAEKITNIHISDSKGNVDHFALGYGTTDLQRFIDAFRKYNIDCTLILEIDAIKVPNALFNEQVRISELEKSVKMLRSML